MPPAQAAPISVTVPKMLSEHVPSQWSSSLPTSRSTPTVASVHPISLPPLTTIPLAVVAPAQASQAGRGPVLSNAGAALLQSNSLTAPLVTVAAMQLQPPPLHPLPRTRVRERERDDARDLLEEHLAEVEAEDEPEMAASEEHDALEPAPAPAPLVNNSLLQLASSLQQQPNVLMSLLLLAAQQQNSNSSTSSSSGSPDMSLLPLLLLAQPSAVSSDSLLSALLTLRSAVGSSAATPSQTQSACGMPGAPASASPGGAGLASTVKMLSALLGGGVRAAGEEKPMAAAVARPEAAAEELAAQASDAPRAHAERAAAPGAGAGGGGGRQASKRPARGGCAPLSVCHSLNSCNSRLSSPHLSCAHKWLHKSD